MIWSLRVPYLLSLVLLLANASFLSPESVGPPTFGVLEVVGLVTTVAAARGSLTRHERRSWWLLAAGFVLLGLTGAALVGSGFGRHPDNLDGVSIGGFLAGILLRLAFAVCLLIALLLLNRQSSGGASRWRLILDVLTVVGGGLMVLWYFVLGPILTNGHLAHVVFGLAFSVLALADLVLVLGVSNVLLRGVAPGERRPVLLLLASCLGFLAGDVFLVLGLLHPQVFSRQAANLLQLVPQILLVLAATEQRRRNLDARMGRGSPTHAVRPVSWLPYAALLVSFSLLSMAAVREGLFPWIGLIAATVLMGAAVGARQFLVLRENRALATTDVLTGLANRVQLHDVVGGLGDRPAHQPAAILLIDLDDFKPVNDQFGHEAGDALLAAFAEILRSRTRAGDVSARLGGDEFAVVLPNVTSADDAAAIAKRILDALRTPVRIAGQDIQIKASIGVAVSVDGSDTADLMRQADLAMYVAKRQKTHGWCFYEPGMGEAQQAQARLEQELAAALDDGGLRVYYQPIVALGSGRIVGVETLIRWQHPEHGMLAPGLFLPLAESSGLIDRIDAWVLERSARQTREWQDGLPAGTELRLNVNISPARLKNPDLVSEVLAALADSGLDPCDLVLEVTETAVLEVGQAVAHLTALREHGIRVALDDFGTGYSSLAHLVQLPVDILKLDRYFVGAPDQSAPSAAIAQTVAGLGRMLHLETVAEGIETADQAEQMRALGYGNGQGYHFARPLPADELGALLHSTESLMTHRQA